MEDMVTIKVYVSTNKVGSECETEFDMPRTEWEAMTDTEKEYECSCAMHDMIEWNWVEE